MWGVVAVVVVVVVVFVVILVVGVVGVVGVEVVVVVVVVVVTKSWRSSIVSGKQLADCICNKYNALVSSQARNSDFCGSSDRTRVRG